MSNTTFHAPAAALAAPRYDRLSIAFHWLTAVLVGLAYLAIEIRGPSGTASRSLWTSVHIGAGLAILTLSVARLAWRAFRRTPPPANETPLLRRLAAAAHAALYIFLVAQPILGILMLNTGGYPVVVPGLGWSIQVVPAWPLLHGVIKEAHELIGNAFYFVIGAHALAALWHHFVVRDDTLRRMAPR